MKILEDTKEVFFKGDAQWILVNYKIALPTLYQVILGVRYEMVKQVSTADGELVLFKRGGHPKHIH